LGQAASALMAGLMLVMAGARPSEPPDRPSRAPSLLAHRERSGAVVLSWSPERGHRVQVWRSTSAQGLAKADMVGFPVSRWTVPTTANRWVDDAPADGVTYHYRVVVDGAPSGITAMAIPPKTLPPLKAPEIAVDKAAYVLTVLDGQHPVKRYPIALGRAPARRKLTFDNASTPEGLYHIVGVQPNATYHKAYDLDYPNAIDRERYRLARGAAADFPPIGGEIQIHGKGIDANWTFGCVAMRDGDIDELFAQPAIGRGTRVSLWGGELTQKDVEAMARRLGVDK
jgi:hypothetical protein